MIIKNQVSVSGTENIKEKLTFDSEAQIQGVVIKVYHTDNVVALCTSKNVILGLSQIEISEYLG